MTDKELKHSIGRLIMPRLNVDEFTGSQKYRAQTERLVRTGKAGGFCIFGGTVTSVLDTTSTLQEFAKEVFELPLLFSCDAEWGITMRIRGGGTEFPHARAFARAKDATLIEEASYRIAMELRALGIWWHFAPVADVNTNPYNPIINVRAYSETAESVSKNATIVYHGIRRANVIACAKHFPGHGNTFADSHNDLPVLNEGAGWIKANDLPPFKTLIDEGIPSIMTGHIAAPDLAMRYQASEEEAYLPATISRPLTTELLRRSMHFEGVIVTDSLEMGGIRKVINRTDLLAKWVLAAGTDVLLMPPDPIETHAAIWRCIDAGELDPQELERSVERVHGLIRLAIAGETPAFEETINRGRTRSLALKIAEKAIKVKGDIGAIGEATEIIIVSSGRKADIEKVQACKASWETLELGLPISVISSAETSLNATQNPILVTFDRPHGVLGNAVHQNDIENVLGSVIDQLREVRADLCLVLLGNPYLEKLFEDHEAACTVLTYSTTEPSIIAAGNIIKNAR